MDVKGVAREAQAVFGSCGEFALRERTTKSVVNGGMGRFCAKQSELQPGKTRRPSRAIRLKLERILLAKFRLSLAERPYGT